VAEPSSELIYEANPHQVAVLESQKPLTFLGAGVGAGKTDAGTLWMLNRVMETPPGVLGLIGANTYGQLYDATLRNILKNLDAWGWPHQPGVLPGGHGAITLKVSNGRRWVEILCRSMDTYENLSGIEIGWFWLDEVWQTKREAFNLIQARNRDKRVQNVGLLTTTLDDPASWMYEVFVDGYDERRMEVIYASTHDNAHNLPDDYIDGLQSTYSAKLFDRMVLAKWVSLESGLIYHAFDRRRNVYEIELVDGLPVYWALDFNIGQDKPMSSCVCQITKGEGPDGTVRPELHVLDELILESSDTRDAVAEFEARGYGADKSSVIVHGDATGKARDTRSKTSDYGIISDAGYTRQRVPAKNPPIRTRHNVVNRLLESADGDVRLLIHPRCKTLIKGLETGKLKGGANYIEEENYWQHVTTALGYLACVEFPERQRVTGGRPLIRMARRN
jgi:hypothetical protein